MWTGHIRSISDPKNKSDKFVDVWAYQGIYTYVCRKSLKIRSERFNSQCSKFKKEF